MLNIQLEYETCKPLPHVSVFYIEVYTFNEAYFFNWSYNAKKYISEIVLNVLQQICLNLCLLAT